MRAGAVLLLWLSVAASPAQADECAEKFRHLLVERNSTGPVKITAVQKVKGAPEMRSINYQLPGGHWMTEMVEPATMPWTLVHDNRMFTSTDKGKTWKLLRTLDSTANADASRNSLETAAATVNDVACGQETIDGVAHDVVAGSYEMAAMKTKHRDTFWVEPKSGWIARSETITRMAGFESTVTQTIEKAPSLTLPAPK